MTLDELKNYRYITAELKKYEKELAELYDDSAGSVSPDMSGMPHGSSAVSSKVESGYEKNEKRFEELNAIICKLRSRLQKLNDFFDSINDFQTLRIFELRYKKDFTWQQVASKIGGNNTEDSVKKRCYRYIDKYNSKTKAIRTNRTP